MNETDLEVATALLKFYPDWTVRQELAQETGLARTSVYDSLMRLEREGILQVTTEPRVTQGRPKTLFKLDLEAL